MEGLIGAGRHQRSVDRLNYRNGYRTPRSTPGSCARRSGWGRSASTRKAPGVVPDRAPATQLDLAAYPYLPRVTVATTSAKAYLALLGGAAA